MQSKFIKYFSGTLVYTALCLICASALILSCEKDDEDDGKIVLNSFGPMPVARGAELRFIGQNLNKVTAIIIPDNIEITVFGTKTSELLTITVPQDAVEGYVVLETPQGDITTKTQIGFSEPISIADFSPAEIKIDSLLTISGDYLNLVKEVIFTDRIAVGDTAFLSQSREEITLKVPAEAQTGKIAVSNGADDPIIVYSEEVLNIVLPGFTAISPNPVKAGTDVILTGSDLDLVKTVVFGGNKNVSVFKSQSGSQLVITVPEDAQDGKLILIPASGVHADTSSATLVMVVPTVNVTPVTVKNGGEITVTGTNLDLVDKVIFGGDKEGTIQAGGTATQLKVTVPEDAVTGVVRFATKANKEVSGPSLTLIDPVFSSFSPASAKPNTNITITGTNLDLVVDVGFTGDKNGTIGSGRTDTQLTVSIPLGAQSGKITLVTRNGSEILSSGDITILTNLPVFTSYDQSRGEPGKLLGINGTSMLLIKELVFPGNKYATAFGQKTDTKVEVYVPQDVTLGYGQIRMITYEGEEGLLPQIYFGGTDPVYNQELCFFDFNGTGKDSWWGNAIGSGIVDDDANSADGSPFWRVNGMSGTGWWDGLFFRNGSNNFVTTGVEVATWAVRFDINIYEPLTEGILKIRFGNYYYEFKPWDGVSGGYKTEGWITVTCPLTGFKDGSTVLTDPAVGGQEFGMIWASGNSVKVNLSIDNVRFEPLP